MDAVSDRVRDSRPPPERPSGAVTRVLVIANETVAAPAVRDRIRALVGSGAAAEVFVVAPALTHTRFEQLAGDVDDAIAEARRQLDESVRAIRDGGMDASGAIGDSDPKLAVDDALRRFRADHVVIATHPPGRSKWLESDLIAKARADARVPVTHVTVDMERGGVEVVDVEEIPRAEPGKPATVGAYDLPRMPPRDVAAIVVGIIGTIVLGVLAIGCSGDISQEGMSAGCAIRIGLAIAAFFVTVFHVAALMFFGFARYRGRMEKFAAYSLLAGIPPAILISALVG